MADLAGDSRIPEGDQEFLIREGAAMPVQIAVAPGTEHEYQPVQVLPPEELSPESRDEMDLEEMRWPFVLAELAPLRDSPGDPLHSHRTRTELRRGWHRELPHRWLNEHRQAIGFPVPSAWG